MFARKNNSNSFNLFPKDWIEEIMSLLNEVYSKKLNQLNLNFEVYGEIYPNELLFITTLVDKSLAESNSCQTFYLSIDLGEKSNTQKLNKNLVDAMGLLIDEYFKDPNSVEQYPRWTEENFKDLKIFYRTGRENVKLSLEANKLLAEN